VTHLVVYDGNSAKKLGLIDLINAPATHYHFVRKIAIDPKHPEIIYASIAGAGISNMWRSNDGGQNWTDISYNLPRGGGSHRIAVNPHTGELFANNLCGTYILPPPYESQNLVYDKCASLSTTESNNHPPVLQPIGSQSVQENALLTFTVTATDPEGDTIVYLILNRPTGASFVNQTFRLLSGRRHTTRRALTR